jgi:FkbM family methyltransferase
MFIWSGADKSFQAWTLSNLPNNWTNITTTFENNFSISNEIEKLKITKESKKRTNTREELLTKLGLDPNKKHVINVGLFTPRKNQAEVIEYARMLKDYPIQFHFIGNQADNFQQYWQPLMKDFPSNCKWWGERSDVDTFFEMADLFLFTSRGHATDKETMPLVIREAISWKTPSLIFNLDVYLDYFDKFSNIDYLDFNSKGQNIKSILNKLGMQINKVDEVFDITFDSLDNKITLYHKKQENKKYKISIKDKDSNAPIYWFQGEVGPNSSWWMIPIPVHAYDFTNNPDFGSFLLEFYDEQNNLLFDKTIFIKESKNKLKLNLKNPFDCLFNNYNEMFVDGKYDCYELDKMETVLDIGANSGLFSFLCINKGAKKVYAFEPNQESLQNLNHIVKGINVEVIDKAVYTKDQDLKFYIDPTNTTIGSVSKDHIVKNGNVLEEIIVPAVSLKTFFTENNIDRISLVKMDIEGAEYDIIENLESEVFKKIDSFLIEYHDNYSGQAEKLVNKLVSAGYYIDQIRDQNSKNNEDIKYKYTSSILGTIFAKKVSKEKLIEKQTLSNMNKQVLVEKSDINLFDMYNGHFNVQYKGVPYLKCPMDYVLYQMLIMNIKPDLIIEIGTLYGGGALYYADLLYLLGKGQVHTINLHNEVYDQKVINHGQIKFFYGGFDAYDIEENTKGFEKILVIDDAAHTYEDVLKALNKFNTVVSKESYFIVEDGVVSFTGAADRYGGGPRKAINEFLQTNDNFIVDRGLCDFFGTNATFNPDGYLKRIK